MALFTPLLPDGADCDDSGPFAGFQIRSILGGRIRVTTELSDSDRKRHDAAGEGESVVVEDLKTGITFEVRSAPCGLSCYCDAEIVRVLENPVAVIQEAEFAAALAAKKAELRGSR